MKIFGKEFKFNGFDLWHKGNFDPDTKANISHTHIKANITDFPNSLPANGGNADTVDGKHASDFAPSGYGLGGTCRSVSGDWDSYVNTGFYMGSSLTNSPPATNGSHSWWYVLVMLHNISPGYVLQLATDFNNKATYRRAKVNGAWSAWTLLYTSDNKPTPSDIGALGSGDNAVSASKWSAARTINLGGDLSGSIPIDGSADVTINATVKDDSHNHVIDNIDNLQTVLNDKVNISPVRFGNSNSGTAQWLKLCTISMTAAYANFHLDLMLQDRTGMSRLQVEFMTGATYSSGVGLTAVLINLDNNGHAPAEVIIGQKIDTAAGKTYWDIWVSSRTWSSSYYKVLEQFAYGSGTSLSFATDVVLTSAPTTANGYDSVSNPTYDIYAGGKKVWHSGNLTNLNQLTNGPGYVTASHNHAIGNVDGLQAALDGKSGASHNHDAVYIQKSLASVTDFNNALTEGEMSIGSSTSVTNAPYTGAIYGKLRIYVNDGGTHNNSSNWIWQYFDDTSGKQYFRNKTNSSAWSVWIRIDSGAFAKASHTHTKSQITDMPTKLSEFLNDIGAGGGIKITTSSTAPSSASPGDFWYKEI